MEYKIIQTKLFILNIYALEKYNVLNAIILRNMGFSRNSRT